jgi:excisionase family DNA binding protein
MNKYPVFQMKKEKEGTNGEKKTEKTTDKTWDGVTGVASENELRSSITRSLQDDCNNLKLFENQADHWLTTKEAANYLRISPKCLLNLTSNGKIRYFKFGRRNRFLLNDIKNLLLANPRGGSYGY